MPGIQEPLKTLPNHQLPCQPVPPLNIFKNGMGFVQNAPLRVAVKIYPVKPITLKWEVHTRV